MKQYDYIFAGAGLSALMTVYEMVLSGKFTNKSILLLDKNAKQTNDRTWCFWTTEDTVWEPAVSKKWQTVLFANATLRLDLNLKPYQYNKIQGLDFYRQVLDLISKQPNIHFVQEEVVEMEESENSILVQTETQSFCCTQLFNSIFNPKPVKSQSRYPLLQQHFVGWFIQTEAAVFNPDQAVFMDFSVEQKGNTRFMYVLPVSKTEALLEYTLFSKEVLDRKDYELEIEKYIRKLGIDQYQIVDTEVGNIPMSCYPFWKHNTKNVLNIGSAGGWTKASTGFTFKNSSKKSKQLVRFLETESDFRKFHKKDKFWFYDLLFIDVLYKNNALGSALFSSLFKKGKSTLVFKFLDEETTFLEDLQVMLQCPKIPFAQALFKRLFRF